jgi:hypothetical protein
MSEINENKNEKKTTTNGDAIKNESKEQKAKEPRSFFGKVVDGFNSLDPAVQVILAVTAGICALAVTGSAIDTIKSAQDRKTLNSDGFKHLVDRGLLDPVAPPKTLEEAAARNMEHGMRMLPVHHTDLVVMN